jgi:predicted AAA+ superfamily ATPase
MSTVRECFHILEDTLLARMLPAWTMTSKRKAIATAKYYYNEPVPLVYWRSTSNSEVDARQALRLGRTDALARNFGRKKSQP